MSQPEIAPVRGRGRTCLMAVAPLVLCAFLSGCIFVSGEVNPFSRRRQPLGERVISGAGKDKLLLIDLTGEITGEEQRSPLGIGSRESTLARMDAELEHASEDDRIRAVIVRIDSPGGGVTASDVVYQRLMRFKAEHQVPIVAQMMSMATSGGYYAALAADEIVANPTSVTGSIGVIFAGVSLAGLLEKIGVENQTIKTGNMKDIGSPLRTMTAEERTVLQNLLGDMQARFLGLVRERRPQVTEAALDEVSDGRLLSAPQALQAGLIDRIGYLDETIENLKEQLGIETAKVVRYRRPDEYAETVYSRGNTSPPQVNLLHLGLGEWRTSPQFLYLWMP